MYSIIVFVPQTHLEIVKKAMFDAGAGKIGCYDCCCFEIEGKGQFRPLDGSDPFLGERGKVEIVKEVRVEMVCDAALTKETIQAMKSAHPYETPAYYVFKCVDDY